MEGFQVVYCDCLSPLIRGETVPHKTQSSTLFAVRSSISLSLSLYFVNATRQLRFRRPRFPYSLHSSPLAPPSFFRLSGNSSFAADYSEPTKKRISLSARSVVQFYLIQPILLPWKRWLPFGWTTTPQPGLGNSAANAETTTRRRPDGPN